MACGKDIILCHGIDTKRPEETEMPLFHFKPDLLFTQWRQATLAADGPEAQFERQQQEQ